MRNPWVGEVVRLYRHTEGRLGPSIYDNPSWLIEALDVVSDAVGWRRANTEA